MRLRAAVAVAAEVQRKCDHHDLHAEYRGDAEAAQQVAGVLALGRAPRA